MLFKENCTLLLYGNRKEKRRNETERGSPEEMEAEWKQRKETQKCSF